MTFDVRCARFLLTVCIASVPGRALGQPVVEVPQFVNVYWIKDGGTNTDWNNEVLDSGTSGITQLTVDTLESITKSLIISQYYKDLVPYGVENINPVLLPHIIGECQDPPGVVPPYVTPLDSAHAAEGALINCILGNHPELADSGIVLNIFTAPSVTTSDAGFFCSVHSAQNDQVGGHATTWEPVNPFCLQDLTDFLHNISHETAEATCGNSYVADDCNEKYTYSFLGLVGPNPYDQFGTYKNNPVCVPAVGEIPVPSPPVVNVCGSGQLATMQLSADPKNTVPWDLGVAGYQGSFYAGAEITHTGSTWLAGFQHYVGLPHPVNTGPIVWLPDSGTSNAYIEIDGFGSGYGQAGNVLAPGDSITPMTYEPMWGQPSKGETIAEDPDHYADAGWYWYGSVTSPSSYLVSELVGRNSCGSSVGHIVGPRPIGDDVVSIVASPSTDTISPSSGLSTTDENGNVLFTFTPNTGGQKSVTLTAVNGASGLSETLYSYVLPVVTSISPSIGSVAGGQNILVRGKFLLTGSPAQVLRFQAGAGAADATNVSVAGIGQIATATTPASPIPRTINGGTGPVLVIADGNPVDGGLGAVGTTYTYIIPGKPYVSFTPSCICNEPNCTFKVFDADGGLDPSVGSISLSGTNVTFGARSVQNGGTTTCTFQDAGSVSAWVTSNPDAGSVTSGTQYACPGQQLSCLNPPLLWDGPFSSIPRDDIWIALHAQQIWVQAHGGDFFDFLQPQIYSWTSSYAFTSFIPVSLGIESMWSLREQMSGQVSSNEVVPATSPPGSKYTHLCFPGSALDVGLNASGSPNWTFTVAYPVPFADVPASNYRVFGRTTVGNGPKSYWSEMSSSIQGSKIVALDYGGSDGHGDYVTGPYALAYWSQTACGAGN